MKKWLSLLICISLVTSLFAPSFGKVVFVKGIQVVKKEVILTAGTYYDLQVKYTPANTNQTAVSVKISNPKVIEVDATLRISAKAAGTSKVTVTSKINKKYSDTFTVKVVADVVPGYVKNAKKPITFDWYVDVTWFSRRWGTDLTSQAITKKTGVSLNIINAPSASNDKMLTMIAANALPDMVTFGGWQGYKYNMIQNKQIYSLTELADKYDKYFYKAANKFLLNYWTESDGKAYFYPNAAQDPTAPFEGQKIDSQSAFMVRKDMYEAIGKPDMTKPDKFLAALEAVKKKFPTENGKPIIPFGLGFDFTSDTGNYAFVILGELLGITKADKNNKFNVLVQQPDYVKWIKTFRQAHEKGYMPENQFIDDMAARNDKIQQGLYFSLIGSNTNTEKFARELYNVDPMKQYISIDGPRGTNAPRLRGGGSPAGWLATAVSKNCKDPERAIQFITYLLSDDGQKDLYLGPKNVTWNMKEGVPTLKPEVETMYSKANADFVKKYGSCNSYLMLMSYDTERRYLPDYVEPKKSLLSWTYKYVVNEPYLEGITPTTDSDAGKAFAKFNAELTKLQPHLLLSDSDAEVDKLIKDFNSYLEKIGFDDYQKFYAATVKTNKTKMGIQD